MVVNLAKANNINKLASYGDKFDNDGNKFHKDGIFKMWECIWKWKNLLDWMTTIGLTYTK